MSRILFFTLSIVIVSFNNILGQAIPNNNVHINGNVIGKILKNDTIYFNTGVIDKKYFEKPSIASVLRDNHFDIETQFSYPHLFRVVFLSDKNIRVWRFGKYFIDPASTSIEVNHPSEECNEVNGDSFNEYNTKVIPFFLNNLPLDCKSNQMESLIQNKSQKSDSLLFKYVIKNPESFVALWLLIERFSLFGQSELRQRTLEEFSKKVKSSKIWNILKTDLENSKIKENEGFPIFTVKSVQLQSQNLKLPTAKYTLVDFWFSRCTPCLEAFPSLKDLYQKYQSKGFEIISISTDKTKAIPLWQNRIKENKLPWVQYLDENGPEAKKLSINSYPSTYLINKHGVTIKKDLSMIDLENFLKEHL